MIKLKQTNISKIFLSAILTLFMCDSSIANNQYEKNSIKIVLGVVNGQKNGTNISEGNVQINFEIDSEQEKKLFELCEVGVLCKVFVVIDKNNNVKKLISAKKFK